MTPCLESLRTPSQLYPTLWYRGKIIPEHRLVWEQINGPIPKGILVCHRCDNRRCVRLDHLFLGSPADNSADMVGKGRSQRGERNVNAKLTIEQVAAIRRSVTEGKSQRALARYFHVHNTTVRDILQGRTWKT